MVTQNIKLSSVLTSRNSATRSSHTEARYLLSLHLSIHSIERFEVLLFYTYTYLIAAEDYKNYSFPEI